MLEKATIDSNEIILLGDVNVNYLFPDDNKEFKCILTLFGLIQMVTKPTRITETSQTLIDIIATNNPSNLDSSDTIPTCISDHEMVGCA